MKKKAKIIIGVIVAGIVILAGVISLIVYDNSLTDIDKGDDIYSAIKSAQQSFSENEAYKKFNKPVSDEEVKTAEYFVMKNGDYASIFYQLNSNTNVLILKKSNFSGTKYKLIASSSTEDYIEKSITTDEDKKIFSLFVTQNKQKFDTVKIVDKNSKKELFTQKINAYPYYTLYVNDNKSNIEIQYVKNNKVTDNEKW